MQIRKMEAREGSYFLKKLRGMYNIPLTMFSKAQMDTHTHYRHTNNIKRQMC